jgi:hypothetical protein
MYNLKPNIILQNALSTELDSIIFSFEEERQEIDNILNEYSEIIKKELFVDSLYYSNKLKELQELFISKRYEYLIRFEILKTIVFNAIFLN